ncbi:MAG: VCBS repeat-containing protein [Phycisphaeraceae bacterium]|nr:VCBS repeat-containing protein [Phycisphaeraceae bacterium]
MHSEGTRSPARFTAPSAPTSIVAVVAGLLGAAATASAAYTEESVARGLVYPVAAHSAFDLTTNGVGALFADLDNDGDPDIVVIGRADTVVGVFENDGSGNFADRTAGSGIPTLIQASAICAADYDADGDIDIFLGAWVGPNYLVRNDGGFTFTDVTATAGVGGTTQGATSGSAWADYDGDGWVDLYVSNYVNTLTNTGGQTTEENHFYKNMGDGTFVDVAAMLGVQDPGSPTLQTIFFDHDLDGDADLYLSTDKGYTPGFQNHLFQNNGGVFAEITGTAGVAANYDSMGVAIGDFDGNGLQDLYPTNIPLGTNLYLNQGSGVFTEAGAVCGVRSFRTGWAAHFYDSDNNGYSDLYVCNQDGANRLYLNFGSFPVGDFGPALGVALPGFSFGLAVADVDNDGDLDLLVPNRGEQVSLLINNDPLTNEWVKFHVVGQGANTHAIGAVVTVTSGATSWLREVFAGGNTYKSQNDTVLHFGLGSATSLDLISTRWTGGATRTISGYATRQTWTIYPDARLGDDDGDGDVELDDFFAFSAAYHAPAFVPGLEAMDLDGDADVDDDDFTEFLARYTGPNGDCNNDMISDLQEILNDPMIDMDLDGVPDNCAPALPGDLNGDCVVDTADLGILLGSFGSAGPVGDLNGDGVVDTADLGILLGAFGSTCP